MVWYGWPIDLRVIEKDPHMDPLSTRLMLGFLAGALSYLLFQGAFGSILYLADLIPALPWNLMPVPPIGLPKSLSLGFWAGLWGLVYVSVEPRLSARLGWCMGGLVFGLAPLTIYWFVALPLKGLGVGGGFQSAMVPIEVGFHAVFGFGVAILFRSSLALVHRKVRPSPEAYAKLKGGQSEHYR